MSKRTPAGDKGTADRIEADDGGYWVRLVTKQALIREGECLVNCLRHGSLSRVAGDEETISDGLWSLRKACGTSYALVEVRGYKTSWQVVQLQGPHNHNPFPWSVRQVRHLRALFAAAGLDLWVDPKMVLVGPDGMTHRPDKAPADVRAAAEAERIEHERWAAERRGARPSLSSMPPPQFELVEIDDVTDVVSAAWRTGLGVDTQPPTRTVTSVELASRHIWAHMSNGEIFPLKSVFGLPDGTTVTGFEDMAVNLVVRLSNGEFHEVPHPAPRAVTRLTLGADTQPPTMDVSSWAEANLPLRSGEQYGGFASFIRSHLAHVMSSIDVPYEETVGDWRRSAERARIATELDATVRMTPLRYPGDRT